jgi:hypothetical protein
MWSNSKARGAKRQSVRPGASGEGGTCLGEWDNSNQPTAVDGREVFSHCNQGSEAPYSIPRGIDVPFLYQVTVTIP